MPQIAQLAGTYASQIFWMLVVFGLIFFVIGKGMVPKITATMDDRNHRISRDLAAAEQARRTADQVEETYRNRLNEARTAAQRQAAEAKAAAAAEAETKAKAADAESAAKLKAAEARIAAQAADASSAIETVAAEAAQDIVQRLAGVSVDRARADTAVRAALARA